MNIGIFFKHSPTGGGIYQYFLSVMESIPLFQNKDRFFLYHCHDLDGLESYAQAGITTVNLSSTETESPEPTGGSYEVTHNGQIVRFKTRPFSKALERAARGHDIDLMLYTNIERESFECGVPFVTAFHDWTHLTHPEFDEFVSNGVYDQREYINQNSTKKARAIFADSETAKSEIMTFYNVPSDKIVVLPFVPPPAVRRQVTLLEKQAVKEKYRLPEQFLFYPAQFWPHKNHEAILKALSILKKNYSIELPIVLVGSTDNPWSNLEKLKALAGELGISNQIIYPGYVADQDMAPLYMSALTLVMPTFPGPTNIPVLEALSCGCPVITTDQKALREQLGDAAEFVDPYQPSSIALAIGKLKKDPAVRECLIEKGYERLKAWGPEHFAIRLAKALSAAGSAF